MNKFYNKSTIDLEWKEMLSSANAYFDTFNQKKYTFHQVQKLKIYQLNVNGVVEKALLMLQLNN